MFKNRRMNKNMKNKLSEKNLNVVSGGIDNTSTELSSDTSVTDSTVVTNKSDTAAKKKSIKEYGDDGVVIINPLTK